MTRVLLDADLRRKLHDCRERIQLVDESGIVVASVLPAVPATPSDGSREPQLTAEQLRQAEQGPWYTAEEVLSYLEKL